MLFLKDLDEILRVFKAKVQYYGGILAANRKQTTIALDNKIVALIADELIKAQGVIRAVQKGIAK